MSSTKSTDGKSQVSLYAQDGIFGLAKNRLLNFLTPLDNLNINMQYLCNLDRQELEKIQLLSIS